jgi:hypothetical protein
MNPRPRRWLVFCSGCPRQLTADLTLDMSTHRDSSAQRQAGSQLAYLTRVLKTPACESVDRLAAAAREQAWTYEEFLAAVSHHEVTAREAHAGEAR